MRVILFIASLVLFLAPETVYAKKEVEVIPSYEIEGAGTGVQGTYLVQVTVSTKDKNLSDDVLKRAAIHGVLFRGFGNKELRQHQKPLAGSPANEAQHVNFYKEFFGDTGSAPNYATIVSGTRSITKADKLYRIKATLSVDKETLVKYLKDMGVIKSLTNAF